MRQASRTGVRLYGISLAALCCVVATLLLGPISCTEVAEQDIGRVAEPIQNAVQALVVVGAPAGSIVTAGILDASYYIDVSFGRPGRIIELGAQPGQRVQRGQFLGLLESESLRDKLSVARSQRDRARRGLPATRLSRNRPPPAYLERSSRARRSEISPQVAMQDTDLRRLKQAVEEGGQQEATRVALSILQQRNRKPRSGTADRLAHDRHTERLHADLVDKVQALEEYLDLSRLVSPVQALVLEVNTFVGDTWNPRSQVSTYRLMDDRLLVVWALAPEKLALRLQRGDPVLVQFFRPDGSAGSLVHAEVDKITGVQVESVVDGDELELLRRLRIALPRDLPAGVDVGDDALVAFPP